MAIPKEKLAELLASIKQGVIPFQTAAEGQIAKGDTSPELNFLAGKAEGGIEVVERIAERFEIDLDQVVIPEARRDSQSH